MNLEITRIISLTPYGFMIQWAVRKPPPVPGDYTFSLFRSGGPDGPWEPIQQNLTNAYFAIDRFDSSDKPDGGFREPNQIALFRSFYYKVTVTAPNGMKAEAIGDNNPSLDRRTAQSWRRAVRNLEVKLKLDARDCAILKRRRWGQRCPKCTDSILREPLKSACLLCWGTGFLGGFWTPTRQLVQRLSGDPTSQNVPEGRTDTNGLRCIMQHFPEVERDDVLVFLDDNRRFVIEKVTQPEIKNRTTHQSLSVSELDHSHILYRFKVDLDSVHPLI